MMDNNNRESNPFESGSGDWKPTDNGNTFQDAQNGSMNSQEAGNGNVDFQPENQPFDYGNNQSGQQTNEPPQNKPQGFAITSMVLGIVGLVFVNCCCCCFGLLEASIIAFILGGVGLAFGIITLVKNGRNGKAIAGVVMCAITLLYAIVFLTLQIISPLFIDEWMKYLEETYPDIFEEYSDLYPGGGYGDM